MGGNCGDGIAAEMEAERGNLPRSVMADADAGVRLHSARQRARHASAATARDCVVGGVCAFVARCARSPRHLASGLTGPGPSCPHLGFAQSRNNRYRGGDAPSPWGRRTTRHHSPGTDCCHNNPAP